MSRHIKNLEKVYDILVECRKAFKDLNGATTVSLRSLNRLCLKIDRIIDSKENIYESRTTAEEENTNSSKRAKKT
jgi:hypothetical protein